MKSIFLAALAAIAVQPLVLLAWLAGPSLVAGEQVPLAEMATFSLYSALFAMPFVVLIGIPAALLLRHHPRRGWRLATIGFVAAALPMLFAVPAGTPGSFSGGTVLGSYRELIVDGVPTIWGWVNYLYSASFFGLHGLIGALVFHHAWRALTAQEPECEPRA